MTANVSGRSGRWDDLIDGKALEQTIFRMCKVSRVSRVGPDSQVFDCFPPELCEVITSGSHAVAPSKFKIDGQAFTRRDQEPKYPMSALFFGELRFPVPDRMVPI
jgi:hypothetical protein